MEWHRSGHFTESCEFGSMSVESSTPVFLALKTIRFKRQLRTAKHNQDRVAKRGKREIA